MELILVLISIHCNSFFDYKGCYDETKMCVENYVAEVTGATNFYLEQEKYPSYEEKIALAAGFNRCTQRHFPCPLTGK